MNDMETIDTLAPIDAAAPPPPHELTFTARIISQMRAHLAACGLHDYQIFYGDDEMEDIDVYLHAVDPDARWAPLEAADPLITRLESRSKSRPQPSGWLHLRASEVMLGRWTWVNTTDAAIKRLTLCAAPTPQHYQRLRSLMQKQRRSRGMAMWQIVCGERWRDEPPMPRGEPEDHPLVIPAAVRQRIEVDLIGFFGETVADMYRRLNVPYRRGVLLHGPPGNGKTSLIRFVGASLPHIPAMILRPVGSFEDAQLQHVIRRWSEQAPCILVIEDLNWMLESVDVSLFLNLLDGIDAPCEGGLLLIATTNDPEALDPAINNRPGRFDVAIEVPSPNDAARRSFFETRLGGIDAALLERLVVASDGLSFAHLLEILRCAGLSAISAGRPDRSAEDLLEAAKRVKETSDTARRGFPTATPEIPFGLQHLRR
jgi:hypothetical protein